MTTGPYTPFTLEYDEGWAVFETDREDGLHLDIQRIENPNDARESYPTTPLFVSDAAALEHVRKRAAEGSQYHQEALALHGTVTPYSEES